MLIFKNLTENDFPHLIKLYESVGWSTYLKNKEYIPKMITSSSYTIGAFIESNLVGFIRGFSDQYSIHFIQDIIVKPEHQRKGIGKILINKALAKYAHAQKTILLTDDDEAQIHFYKSCKFKNLETLQTMNCFIKLKD